MAGKTPIYNYRTGETELVPSDQVFRWNNAVNEATGGTPAFSWFYDSDKNLRYGTLPENRYFDPFLEGQVEGFNPYPPGPGPAPYVPGQDRRWDPDAEQLPTYRDTGPLPPLDAPPNTPPPGRTLPDPWQPLPQTPQFGSPGGGVSSDMWTRSYDEGEGFAGQHKPFYDTQFRNLLAQQQNFQDDQIRAAMRRQAAQDNPMQPSPVDWSWANQGQGLPDVQVSTGREQALNFGLGPNATNRQVIDRAYPYLSEGAQQFWGDFDDPAWGAQRNLVGVPPDQVLADSTLAPSNMPYLNELVQAIYNRAQGSSDVPAGYALPRATGGQ